MRDRAGLVEVAFDLVITADAVSLIPVEFRNANRAVSQAHAADALPLAPAALSVSTLKASEFANAMAHSDSLDLSQPVENLEIHASIVRREPVAV